MLVEKLRQKRHISQRAKGLQEWGSVLRVRTHTHSHSQTISTFKCELGSSCQFMNFSIKPQAKWSCALYLFPSNPIGHQTSAETISERLLVDISDHSHWFVWPSSRKACTRYKIITNLLFQHPGEFLKDDINAKWNKADNLIIKGWVLEKIIQYWNKYHN